LSGGKTKKIIRKKKAQPKLRSQKNRQIKARINKPVKSRIKHSVKTRASKAIRPRAKPKINIHGTHAFKRIKKTMIKHSKETSSKHPAHTAAKSHAIRMHEAIKNLGNSIIQKHHDIHYKFVQAVKKSFPDKPHSEKSHSAHLADSGKESITPQKGVLLLNMTKNHMISDKVVFANTPFEKFRGLMFRNRRDVNYALVFDFKKVLKNSAAIHMFFVFFPIDVVYLRDSKVVDLHREVKPFTAYLAPKTRSDTLIELPQGTIWRSGISVGDEILTTSG